MEGRELGWFTPILRYAPVPLAAEELAQRRRETIQGGLRTVLIRLRETFDEREEKPSKTENMDSVQHPRRRKLHTTNTDESRDLIHEPHTYYKYRVGVPPLAVLPLRNLGDFISNDLEEKLEASRGTIADILREHHVQFRSIEFINRILPKGERPSDENAFVFIVAEWDDAAHLTWPACVTSLKSRLQHVGITLAIEIIAPELYDQKSMRALEFDDPFVQAWKNTVRERVTAILKKPIYETLQGNIVAINVLRLGIQYPTPITILITVDWLENPSDWILPQSEIVEALAEYPGVEVLFEHGGTFLLTDAPESSSAKDLPGKDVKEIVDTYREAYKRKDSVLPKQTGGVLVSSQATAIYPGASIGSVNGLIANDGTPVIGSYATVGPIVKLSSSGKELGVFCLTNYHVIREFLPGYGPGDDQGSGRGISVIDSLLDRLDHDERGGFGPNSYPDEFKDFMKLCKSPAVKVLARTILEKEDLLSKVQAQMSKIQSKGLKVGVNNQIKKLSQEISELQKYLDNNDQCICGSIYMGSTPMYRSPKNSRVDYVLIKLAPERLVDVTNKLPERSEWWDPKIAPLFDIAPKRLIGIGSLEEDSDTMLIKNGARTGVTVGYSSPIEASWVAVNAKGKPKDPKSAKSKKTGDSLEGSNEFVVIGGPQDTGKFSDYGDSGSAVWNINGQWIGILWGGTSVQQTGKKDGDLDHLTYVIGAEDICSHVGKELSSSFPGHSKIDVELYSPGESAEESDPNRTESHVSAVLAKHKPTLTETVEKKMSTLLKEVKESHADIPERELCLTMAGVLKRWAEDLEQVG